MPIRIMLRFVKQYAHKANNLRLAVIALSLTWTVKFSDNGTLRASATSINPSFSSTLYSDWMKLKVVTVKNTNDYTRW